jgi:hypothetical protein
MWARSKTLYRRLRTLLQHFCPHRRIGSLIRSWTTRTFGSLWLKIGRPYHNPGAISLRDHQFLLRHPSPLRRPSSLRNLRNPASAAVVLRGKRNASSPTPSRVSLLRLPTTAYPSSLPPSPPCRKSSRPKERKPLPLRLLVPAPRLLHLGHLLTPTRTPCSASPSGTATSRCPLRSAAGRRPPEPLTSGNQTWIPRSGPFGIRTLCCAAGRRAAARDPVPLAPPPAGAASSLTPRPLRT